MKTTVRRALTVSLTLFAVGSALVVTGGELAAEQATSDKPKPSPSPAAAPADPKSLEEFLSQALRSHPDILAAEARLESAQAELTRTRFQITRELITLWNERSAQSHKMTLLEKARGQGAISLQEWMEVKGKASELDAQVSYLLGQMGGAAAREPVAAGKAQSKRLPEGPQVEKVLAELNSPTELQFIETPIWDVVEFVMDLHAFQFVRDPLLPDVSVTMDMKGIPLGAALQAVEDTTSGVRFVVCDYGILVTTDDSEAAAKYISANEFWREQLPEETTSEGAQPAAKAQGGSTSALSAPRKPDPRQGTSTANPLAPTKPAPRQGATTADPFD